MATILFAWELGMGLGHAAQMAPIANALAREGHRVFAALRDLRVGQGLFDPAVVPLPAPFLHARKPSPTVSFATILSDVGFGDDRALPVLASAWRNLIKLARPHLIVFDHAPTALLASRGVPVKRLVLGVGFCVPPDTDPFPPLRARSESADEQLRALEQPLLARANGVLASWGQPPLARLGQLYGEADDTLLTTIPAFDCYRAARPKHAHYVGPVNLAGGSAPDWPPGEGKKVFAYLKPFAALRELLASLRERRLPSLIFIDGVDPATRDEFACETLRFETERMDLARVGRACDLAIINGAHATSIAMLLAGRPSLQIPHFLEHSFNARAVQRAGAGLIAPPNDAAAITSQLTALLESDRFAQAAGRFAARYADFDCARQAQTLFSRAVRLVG